jgi:hypothetical protein
MNLEIIKVDGTSIECPFENDEHYVTIRPLCQALKIHYNKQFEKIKKDPLLGCVYRTVYASDTTVNRKQAMICLPVKYIFGWLFSIDESRISPGSRPQFIKYKQECYDALYEHFFLRATLYEKKEKLIAGKEQLLSESIKEKILISEKINKLKTEISTIRQTPVGQLTLFD